MPWSWSRATSLAIAVAFLTAVLTACGGQPGNTLSPASLASLTASALISSPAASTPLAPLPYPTHGALVEARLVRVVDGDTIVVSLSGREATVRYIGMDTPETVKPGTPVQWMGKEASAANTSELALGGGTVYLQKDVSETDRYGRLLRYVWIRTDGAYRMVNLELLRLGVARVATFPPDVAMIDPWFLDAERGARDAGIGLWSATPPPGPTPAQGSATNLPMAVCGGNRDAPGDDNLNLNGEFVVLCNRSGSTVELSGWRLTDEGTNHTYRFPAVAVAAGASVTLYSGAGTNTATALYWHAGGAVWNNGGDCAYLYDAAGSLVSSGCLP